MNTENNLLTKTSALPSLPPSSLNEIKNTKFSHQNRIKGKLLILPEDRLKVRSINKKIAKEMEILETPSDKRETFKILCKSVKGNNKLKFVIDPIINFKTDSNNKNSPLKTSKKRDISNGSITYKITSKERKSDYLDKLLRIKDDQVVLKKAFKWKNLSSLFENYKFQVEKLVKSYGEIRWFFRKYGYDLNYELFKQLMSLLLLDNEDFCRNLFYIYDEDKDGKVNFRELIINLELYRDDTFASRMQLFATLCDEDDDGFVNLQDFTKTLKLFMLNKKESFFKIQAIIGSFNNLNFYSEHKKLPLELFIKFLVSNTNLKRLFERNKELINEQTTLADDEITGVCLSSLKKSKFNSVQDTAFCTRDYNKIAKILEIKDEYKVQKKINKQLLGKVEKYKFDSEEELSETETHF